MTEYLKTSRENLANQMIQNMKKRNMEGFYCATKEEALEKALSFLEPGCSVSWGGSETLNEIGFMDEIKNHTECEIIDRFSAKTAEEKRQIYARATLSDYYYMSSNAITKDGILVNMDGSGNRVAALCHGPNHVVLVVGMNKVATTVEEAVNRIELVAGPSNTIRQKMDTPCSKTGSCTHCFSKDCICASLVVTRFCRQPGRIKIILVGENLGF